MQENDENLFQELIDGYEQNDLGKVRQIVPGKIGILEKLPKSFVNQINLEFHRHFKEISITLLSVLYDAYKCLPYLISLHVFSSRVIKTAIEFDHTQSIQTIIENQEIDANAKGSSHKTFLITALHSSIQMFRLVLSMQDINLNEKCEDGNTAVLIAAKEGLVQQFIILAQHGADLNITNDFGDSVVHMAIISRKPQMLSEVLKWDADPNIINRRGLTPLLYSIRTHDIKSCEILTKSKSLDINKSDRMGTTPLHQSILTGTHEITQILLNNLAIDVNKTDNRGNTPLHIACKKDCNISVALLASKYETDLNILNKDGKTPFEIAFERKSFKAGCTLLVYDEVIVRNKAHYPVFAYYFIKEDNAEGLKCLLKRGVNFRKITINRTPPLLIAVSLGRVEAIRAILASGQADINARGKKHNSTALHIACTNADYPFVITRLLLLYPSIDVNAQDDNGNTPLYMAIIRKCIWSAELLLEHESIEYDIPNKKGNTPIMAAAIKDEANIGLKLIETGQCDLERTNNNDMTPLMLACWKNSITMVKVLIERGHADPFRETEVGTPFTIALSSQAKETILYLLKIKAYDTTYQNEDGTTIFDLARSLDDQELREEVLSKL